MNFFDDRTKAFIIILILFTLALYNFYSIPEDVLQRMKDRLNAKGKIYSYHNRMMQTSPEDDAKIAQSGGFFGYLDQRMENRMSKTWDEVPNKWDPLRLHDKYNTQANPIVYQGFGIPLMSDLMCSSFAGSDKPIPNSNDRAMIPPTNRNMLGTIPSDKKSMFYFSDNISAPECCPGPYSSDAGCVCSFEKASF